MGTFGCIAVFQSRTGHLAKRNRHLGNPAAKSAKLALFVDHTEADQWACLDLGDLSNAAPETLIQTPEIGMRTQAQFIGQLRKVLGEEPGHGLPLRGHMPERHGPQAKTIDNGAIPDRPKCPFGRVIAQIAIRRLGLMCEPLPRNARDLNADLTAIATCSSDQARPGSALG